MFAHQFNGFHGRLVAARIEQKNDLIDAALLIAAQKFTHGLRAADRAPPWAVGQRRILLDILEVAFPHLGPAGSVLALHVVVHDAEGEEATTLAEPLHCLLIGGCDHHRQVPTDRENVGVDLRGHRSPVLLEFLVVTVHPLGQWPGPGVGETQCADGFLRGHLHRCGTSAGHPHRRVWLLQRLGYHVARRHRDMLAVEPGERLFDHAPDRHLQRLLPLGALVSGVDAETAELTHRRRLAGSELHASIGDQVQCGDPLGDARRVVDHRRQVHDPEAEPDVTSPLAGRRQEDLRSGGVTVLFEEVVLGQPHRREARLVGGLHLIEAVLEEQAFVVIGPGAGQGEFVEQ